MKRFLIVTAGQNFMFTKMAFESIMADIAPNEKYSVDVTCIANVPELHHLNFVYSWENELNFTQVSPYKRIDDINKWFVDNNKGNEYDYLIIDSTYCKIPALGAEYSAPRTFDYFDTPQNMSSLQAIVKLVDKVSIKDGKLYEFYRKAFIHSIVSIYNKDGKRVSTSESTLRGKISNLVPLGAFGYGATPIFEVDGKILSHNTELSKLIPPKYDSMHEALSEIFN